MKFFPTCAELWKLILLYVLLFINSVLHSAAAMVWLLVLDIQGEKVALFLGRCFLSHTKLPWSSWWQMEKYRWLQFLHDEPSLGTKNLCFEIEFLLIWCLLLIDEATKEDLVLRSLWEKSNMESYMTEMRKESKRRR